MLSVEKQSLNKIQGKCYYYLLLTLILTKEHCIPDYTVFYEQSTGQIVDLFTRSSNWFYRFPQDVKMTENANDGTFKGDLCDYYQNVSFFFSLTLGLVI